MWKVLIETKTRTYKVKWIFKLKNNIFVTKVPAANILIH